MKRRAHGEGTIGFWKKKGLWCARITLLNGKRRAKCNKKQAVVKAWLDEQKTRLHTGTIVSNERITVEELLRRYMENYVQDSSRPTTVMGYSWVIKNHILPDLAKVPAAKLQPEQLDQFYRDRRKKGDSELVVFKCHKILRQAFNQSIRWGLCSTNPTKLASPPKVKKTTPKVWDVEQTIRFLNAVRGHRWGAIFYLACGTGMRHGEIIGLPLNALHLEDRFLEINQSLTWLTRQGFIMLPPKTESSRRSIELPDFVVDVLRERLELRASLSQSPNWRELQHPFSNLVFTTNIGTPITPPSLRRFFKDTIAANSLANIKFHELRHTAASLLLTQSVHPKLVSELLGHADVKITLNTYTHLLKSTSRVAANAMQNLISQKQNE